MTLVSRKLSPNVKRIEQLQNKFKLVNQDIENIQKPETEVIEAKMRKSYETIAPTSRNFMPHSASHATIDVI